MSDRRRCLTCGEPVRESQGPRPCDYCSTQCAEVAKFIGALEDRLLRVRWPAGSEERRAKVRITRSRLQTLVNLVPAKYHTTRGPGGRFAPSEEA